jgi:predicted nucleotidyltransferase
MHSLEQFSKLFNAESGHELTSFNGRELPSLNNIKENFQDIVALSGMPFDTIALAYVAGSYSRNQQTYYSDIDIECFAPVENELQDTFYWDDTLISFSVYPMGTVRGEPSNIIDLSWAKSCFKSAYPLHDPHNIFSEYKERFQNDDSEFSLSLGLGKQMRKLIEYRRKLLSAVSNSDKIMQSFAAVKFLETYAVLANIMQDGSISSEKGQFQILDDHGEKLTSISQLLISGDIDEEMAIKLTKPFFDLTTKLVDNQIKTKNEKLGL